MTNEIVTGIAQKIREVFGSHYKIHMDELPQGFQEPCFFILDLTDSSELVIRNRYWQAHRFDLHYFPESQCGITREINEVKSKLFMAMEYIALGGDLIRGTRMSAETQDGVLHFFVDYDVFVFRVLDEAPKMQSLTQKTYVKE